MTARFKIYAGDTLRLPAQRLDAAGLPMSLNGVIVGASVQILTEAKACAIQLTDAALATFDIYAAASATAGWPRGVWPLTVSYEWQLAGEAQRQTEQVALIEVGVKQ